MDTPKRILIIEDSDEFASHLGRLLVGAEIIVAGTLRSAIEQMQANRFDIIIADMMLPGEECTPDAVISNVSLHGGSALKILISGHPIADGLPTGFDAMTNKTFLVNHNDMMAIIARAASRANERTCAERTAADIRCFSDRRGMFSFPTKLKAAVA